MSTTFFGSILSLVFLGVAPAVAAQADSANTSGPPLAINGARNVMPEVIDRYHARFGRARPVIAIIADNDGTELADFVVPYGILSASGVAEVVTVSTRIGDVIMRPALKLRAEVTMDGFDREFEQGADYVIVPAIFDSNDPALLAWITDQARKGSTIVSICNGAEVVANTGLMDGHRATAHWASEADRMTDFPAVHWERNIRYVADGKIISSAGISAAIPTSLALVEAIAGYLRAASVAQELGVAEWSSRHDSDAFQLLDGEVDESMHSKVSEFTFALPIGAGIDELAMALTADAYSHSGLGTAVSLAMDDGAVTTRHGLTVIPDRTIATIAANDVVLNALSPEPSLGALDRALNAIAMTYGMAPALKAARTMEYHGFPN